MPKAIDFIQTVGDTLPVSVVGRHRDLSAEARAQIRVLARPQLVWALLVLVRTWLEISLALGLAAYFDSLWLYLPVACFIATRQNVLALLVHEQVHRTGRSTRWSDPIMNFAAAYWLLISVEGYRKIHLAHHNHYFTDRDPDFVRKQGAEWEFPQSASLFLRTVVRDGLGLNLFRFVRSKRTRTAPAEGAPDSPRRLTPLGFYVALGTALSVSGGWPLFLLGWFFPLVTVLQLIVRWGAICEHRYNLAEPTVEESTPLIVPPWWERLLLPNLNFTYHVYHHQYPSIAGRDLPKVHSIYVNEGLVVKQNLFRGYVSYLRFLFRGSQRSQEKVATSSDHTERPSSASA